MGAAIRNELDLFRHRSKDRAEFNFALPCEYPGAIYRAAEKRAMFGMRKGRSRSLDARGRRQWYERSEESGRAIDTRIAELRSLPRDQLADAAFILSMAAKRQSELILESIPDSAKGEFASSSSRSGVLKTHHAEEAVSILRHHTAIARSLIEFLSERLPDVRFSVQQREAVVLLAAMIREQRLEGILEGLRLGGLLNQPTGDRHAGFDRGPENDEGG
ncbi:hypothetical protein [Bradyrhizobium liaoningense]|uniref:hypothetical protein n=1 Tax=Bradyrhizobium liaoningense TaxID=43992 RepID=UPI001BA69697|nr:hypothetical protein [Bradyrhizobium liaoningense]MBR0988025.1 hypothetical protein [Bradyrhizobium liaoningense]